MILNYDKPNIEAAKLLDEHFFSIEDTSMIFDILRNKMYSNPILAICREISCNARDANRETGTPDLPIDIYLPNYNEAFYKIKDKGTGIDPSRMLDIFIKYTASTKRDSNVFTGGFGLGSKVGFSYSNSFNVVTNYNGTHYNYQCFIDETKIGKLILLEEYSTTEPNGTEIIIPVKESDFHSFETYTEEATRHWDVKPIIKGGEIDYKMPSKILEGKNWFIASVNSYNYKYNYEIKFIIDGIEYSLKSDVLKTYPNIDFIESINGGLYLYFNTGELSLSANREQLYLDKVTQNLIKTRLDDFISEVKDLINIKINGCSNYWDANVLYNRKIKGLFERYHFNDLHWNNIKLLNDNTQSPNSMTTRFKVTTFKKVPARNYYYDKNDNETKIKRFFNRGIEFDYNSLLFINDLEINEINSRHIKKVFEDNSEIKSIQIISFNEDIKEESLNDIIHLHLMEPRKLSEVTKVSKRANTSASSRLTVFKFDSKSCTFDRTSYSSIDEDNSTKVLCILSKDYQSKSILCKNKRFQINTLKIFNNLYPEISFYGVDESVPKEKIDKHFSDFQDLDDFLDEKMTSFRENYFVECKISLDQRYHIDDTLLRHKEISGFITNPESLFLKKILFNNRINELLQDSNQTLLGIYESFYNKITEEEMNSYLQSSPQFNLEKITEEFNEKYPLYKLINSASSYKFKENIRHIAQYINLIDGL